MAYVLQKSSILLLTTFHFFLVAGCAKVVKRSLIGCAIFAYFNRADTRDPDSLLRDYALERLNNGDKALITFEQWIYLFGYPIKGLVKDLSVAKAYQVARIPNPIWDELPMEHVQVCFDDSSTYIRQITSAQELAAFLAKVDSVRAPVMGIRDPLIRKLCNCLTRPKKVSTSMEIAAEKIKSHGQACSVQYTVHDSLNDDHAFKVTQEYLWEAAQKAEHRGTSEQLIQDAVLCSAGSPRCVVLPEVKKLEDLEKLYKAHCNRII